MPTFIFKSQPGGQEYTAFALDEQTARELAQTRIPAVERGACVLELADVLPLACSPLGRLIDPFEDKEVSQ